MNTVMIIDSDFDHKNNPALPDGNWKYVMEKKCTIALARTGYIGLSITTLLSQHHKVFDADIVPIKVDMVNQWKSPIQDDHIEKYLAEKDLDLVITLNAEMAYSVADFVVIAAPINCNSSNKHFDTSIVEKGIMVIKSGYMKSVR